LAEQWKFDDDAMLSVCLAAVVAGLLELRWELVCPGCRLGSEDVGSLSEVTEQGHCQLCDLTFGLDLDRAVEAVFRPAPSVRSIVLGPFCIGSPARSPQVFSQAVVVGGGSATFPVPAEARRYRLFARGGSVASVSVGPQAPSTVFLALTNGFHPGQINVAPKGTIELKVEGEERHVKLEKAEWANRAATAHRLSLHPTFRQLFSSELLRPGLLLRVSRVAVLFTDLTGSTALYTRVGDAAAFRLVQDHFDVLRRVAYKHGGVVIKTIGDAVMAAFPDEASAVDAALAMQREFVAFRAQHAHGDQVALKVGVHSGPCYAVSANGVLDYFGQTVNLAARLQAAAGAGEVVLAETLADEAVRAGWVAASAVVERFSAELKGLDAPVRAARLVASTDAKAA
jgi:class 3 adenylate cyclase